MDRSSYPVLPRMPGSAILAVVFIGLQAFMSLLGGVGLALFPLLPAGFTVLLIANGVLNAAIAIGIAKRQNWARITGIVVCTAALALTIISIFAAAAEGAPSGAAAGLGVNVLLLFFLTQENTRAWCVGLGPTETPLGLADPEPFDHQDQVALVEGIDEIGLRAGTVGTVVDLPAEPDTVVVEFDDHPDREPVQVTLHFNQIRLVAETE